jgi:hypothetical protein
MGSDSGAAGEEGRGLTPQLGISRRANLAAQFTAHFGAGITCSQIHLALWPLCGSFQDMSVIATG